MKRGFHSILIGLGAAAFIVAPALAADPHGEIVTAATHADLAAKASDLAGVQMHMHHALNCLVGPNGQGYDPKNMNPCANAGAGAIPDTTDPARKAELERAADALRHALMGSDLASAQKDAAAIGASLKAIP